MISDLVAAVDVRSRAIVDSLNQLDDAAMLRPSLLPEWSRLTIACHLRFGADAFLRLTRGALDGERAAYYPQGRAVQRPATLVPQSGESPRDVVTSLARSSAALHDTWATMTASQWEAATREPEDNPDLGPLPVSRLPLLRLTEVEVHGSDLDVGLDDWSDTFVSMALPFRLDWLNTRRTNHRDVDAAVEGSWLLDAIDGPAYLVTVDGGRVASRPVTSHTAARATIRGSSRDLLALLLGRPLRAQPALEGDTAFAAAFSRAFPGP